MRGAGDGCSCEKDTEDEDRSRMALCMTALLRGWVYHENSTDVRATEAGASRLGVEGVEE